MAHVVAYTFSFDHYRALLRARRAMGAFGRYAIVLRYVLVIAAAVIVFVALTDWRKTSAADLMNVRTIAIVIGAMVALAVFVALVDLLFERVIYRWVFRRFALAGQELAVTLDDDGIRWAAGGASAHFAWSLVRRVYEGKDLLVIFFSKVEGLLLPRSGVASDEAFRSLVAFVESRLGGGAVVVKAGGRP